jgi:hypothetical protein
MSERPAARSEKAESSVPVGAQPGNLEGDGGPPQESFLRSSYLIIVGAITAVTVLVLAAVIAPIVGGGTADADSISAMLATGTGVIGTLAGSFLGLRAGQQGREEAQERADASRREAERVLWAALASLPPEQAEEITKTNPSNQ